MEEATFRYHNEDPPLAAPVVLALPKPPDKIKRKVQKVGFLGAVSEAQKQGDVFVAL